MTLGERIKSVREKMGISQRELATKSEVAQGTISMLENGKVEELRSEGLRRVAEVLRTSTDYLLGIDKDITLAEIISKDHDVAQTIKSYSDLNQSSRDIVKKFISFMLADQGKGRTLQSDSENSGQLDMDAIGKTIEDAMKR